MALADMNVVGLDLSLRATGVASVSGSLSAILPRTDGDARLVEIRDMVDRSLPDRSIVVIEDLPHGARNPAAGPLGMVHGVVRGLLMDRGLSYVLVPPASVKMYATGKGNASKADMRMAWYQRTGEDVSDDNMVDAAWLRQIGLAITGGTRVKVPHAHDRALERIVVPGLMVDVD